MSSALQKAPLGLLGAFDLKTLGRNPTEFGDRVDPVVEILDFYAPVSRIEQFSAAQAIQINVGMSVTVPLGEIWALRALGGALQFQPGDACPDGFSLALGWGFNAMQSTLHVGPELPAGYTNANLRYYRTGVVLGRPLFLPAQSSVFCWSTATVTGGNRVVSVNLTIQRFLV